MPEPTTIEPLDLRFAEDELEGVVSAIQGFIQDTVAEAGVDRAVLGLSGGIDSTTVAYLAAEALGPEALHGLVMPGFVHGHADVLA